MSPRRRVCRIRPIVSDGQLQIEAVNHNSAAPRLIACGFTPPVSALRGSAQLRRLWDEATRDRVQLQTRLDEIRSSGPSALSIYDRMIAFPSEAEAVAASLTLLQNQIAAAEWLARYCLKNGHFQIPLFESPGRKALSKKRQPRPYIVPSEPHPHRPAQLPFNSPGGP